MGHISQSYPSTHHQLPPQSTSKEVPHCFSGTLLNRYPKRNSAFISDISQFNILMFHETWSTNNLFIEGCKSLSLSAVPDIRRGKRGEGLSIHIATTLNRKILSTDPLENFAQLLSTFLERNWFPFNLNVPPHIPWPCIVEIWGKVEIISALQLCFLTAHIRLHPNDNQLNAKFFKILGHCP